MMIQDRGIPAFHAWPNQKGMCVKIDGKDWRVVEQDRFRVLKRLITRGLIGCLPGLGNQTIILRIRPTGLIIAAAGYPEIEKRIWIVVIADPGGANDLVIHLPSRIEVNFFFLVQKGGADI